MKDGHKRKLSDLHACLLSDSRISVIEGYAFELRASTAEERDSMREHLEELIGQIVMHYKFTPLQTAWFFDGPAHARQNLDRKLGVQTPMSHVECEIDFKHKMIIVMAKLWERENLDRFAELLTAYGETGVKEMVAYKGGSYASDQGLAVRFCRLDPETVRPEYSEFKDFIQKIKGVAYGDVEVLYYPDVSTDRQIKEDKKREDRKLRPGVHVVGANEDYVNNVFYEVQLKHRRFAVFKRKQLGMKPLPKDFLPGEKPVTRLPAASPAPANPAPASTPPPAESSKTPVSAQWHLNDSTLKIMTAQGLDPEVAMSYLGNKTGVMAVLHGDVVDIVGSEEAIAAAKDALDEMERHFEQQQSQGRQEEEMSEPLQEATPPAEMVGMMDVATTNGPQRKHPVPSSQTDQSSKGPTPTKEQLEVGVLALAPVSGDVIRGPEAANTDSNNISDHVHDNVEPYAIPSDAMLSPPGVSKDDSSFPQPEVDATQTPKQVPATPGKPQTKVASEGKRVCSYKFDGTVGKLLQAEEVESNLLDFINNEAQRTDGHILYLRRKQALLVLAEEPRMLAVLIQQIEKYQVETLRPLLAAAKPLAAAPALQGLNGVGPLQLTPTEEPGLVDLTARMERSRVETKNAYGADEVQQTQRGDVKAQDHIPQSIAAGAEPVQNGTAFADTISETDTEPIEIDLIGTSSMLETPPARATPVGNAPQWPPYPDAQGMPSQQPPRFPAGPGMPWMGYQYPYWSGGPQPGMAPPASFPQGALGWPSPVPPPWGRLPPGQPYGFNPAWPHADSPMKGESQRTPFPMPPGAPPSSQDGSSASAAE
ncbi:hypothetical protein HK097_005326 [Rhizophlyctis rosea]|uniref:Uncharacterized protein n=1 Tax=Rhizophlyctis rosea TaxID=64517 RepID=A0AAD5SR16_9FUNG|nr:hypothetical protein HK097_005326 [Rhizophlyctis rosea]